MSEFRDEALEQFLQRAIEKGALAEDIEQPTEPTQTADERDKSLKRLVRQSMSAPQTREAEPLMQEAVKDRQSDRDLKQKYANGFKAILIGQLLVMNIAFFLAGIGVLSFEPYILELYLAGTLAEVFGIVLVITKNLFPTGK